jgi:hypothetical protein
MGDRLFLLTSKEGTDQNRQRKISVKLEVSYPHDLDMVFPMEGFHS